MMASQELRTKFAEYIGRFNITPSTVDDMSVDLAGIAAKHYRARGVPVDALERSRLEGPLRHAMPDCDFGNYYRIMSLHSDESEAT